MTAVGARSLNVLSEIYEITLDALKSTNNERLWFSTNLKLAKVYMEEKKITEGNITNYFTLLKVALINNHYSVENILSVLKKSCQSSDGNYTTTLYRNNNHFDRLLILFVRFR